MSLSLTKLCLKKNLNLYKALASYVVYREKAHWFPQYKPGPYPKTLEEREKAAKKYNLLIEEYEPYPDDGSGLGDYPKLPEESANEKDPFYPWDDEYARRDYLEPIQRDYVTLQPELYSTASDGFSTRDKIVYCGGMLVLFMSLIYALFQIEIHPPVLERQIWKPNTVHYTFDLDHGKKPPQAVKVEKETPPPPSKTASFSFLPTLNPEKLKY